jgi:carotenoid cleavage dioxygenase-like enzyme
VPARGATAEDDGWLVGIIADETTDSGRLLVQDASNISGPPIAVVTLPRRVPSGFHGIWIFEADLR